MVWRTSVSRVDFSSDVGHGESKQMWPKPFMNLFSSSLEVENTLNCGLEDILRGYIKGEIITSFIRSCFVSGTE